MNYIILNGKESTDIKGLMICSLPPISKPQKRVDVEEIDGVDGDIITELGYSAYDKDVEIGLTYDYDVDEVIEYFDSEGIVIFSNEPTKYYKYKIINQIDFERLVRFKTAKITFHIQPFKFSNEERDKIFNITTETEVQVRNSGNVYSKPVLTIYGSGTINLSLNGTQLLIINLGDSEEYIAIDTDKLEAYKSTTLKNRLVTVIVVPLLHAVSSNSKVFPASTTILFPISCSSVFEIIST